MRTCTRTMSWGPTCWRRRGNRGAVSPPSPPPPSSSPPPGATQSACPAPWIRYRSTLYQGQHSQGTLHCRSDTGQHYTRGNTVRVPCTVDQIQVNTIPGATQSGYPALQIRYRSTLYQGQHSQGTLHYRLDTGQHYTRGNTVRVPCIVVQIQVNTIPGATQSGYPALQIRYSSTLYQG